MLHGHLVYVGKTLTGLQILGSELHQIAFGGWAHWGTIALPGPSSRFRARAGMGKGRKELGIQKEWKEGQEGVEGGREGVRDGRKYGVKGKEEGRKEGKRGV